MKQVGDQLELRARLSESQKKIDKREALLEPPDRMIALEDMWERLWEVHVSCGYKGWQTMQPRGNNL